MVERQTKLNIEVSCEELFEIVTALVIRANSFVRMEAPREITLQTIQRAYRLNEILKEVGYDHWAREKFMEMKASVRNESIQ